MGEWVRGKSLRTRLSGQTVASSFQFSFANADVGDLPSSASVAPCQDADSQIPAAHQPKSRTTSKDVSPGRCGAVLMLAFGFDGSLDSSSVLVWVEVQGRQHRRVFGVKRLKIRRELKSVERLKVKKTTTTKNISGDGERKEERLPLR